MIIIISFLLLGSSTTTISMKDLSEKNTEDFQESLRGLMDEPTSGAKQENNWNLDIQLSGNITESHNEFLGGAMDNLTINNNESLSLKKYSLPSAWIQMNPSTHPSIRGHHSMVYDSNSDKGVLFGGAYGMESDDTWVYDLTANSWTQMNPSTKPSARGYHSMVYDSNSDKIILFGGLESVGLDDTWIYDLSTDSWTQMNPSTKPSARYYHSMVYDAASDKVILFGGYDGSYCDDTWVYNLTTDNWTQMNPLTKPSVRYGHSMVYDSTSDIVILFGGRSSTAFFADTWIYNVTADSWTQMNLLTKPGARDSHSMVYNSHSDKVILFGGWNDTSYCADTWVYSNEKYYHNGLFESKIINFFAVYIAGELTWNPLVQQEGTKLKCQIGLSNTTKDEDFQYSDYSTSNFPFGGFAQYLRYRVIFESDVNQIFSPFLESVNIYYSLDKPAVPSAPRGLSATAGENFVDLSWTVPSNDGDSPITSFRVYRGTITGAYFFLGVTTATTFSDNTAMGGTKYYYIVTAVNAIGESIFSNEVSATPTTPVTTQESTTKTHESTSETATLPAPVVSTFPGVLAVLAVFVTLVVFTQRRKNT
jgi:hypothetical protein